MKVIAKIFGLALVTFTSCKTVSTQTTQKLNMVEQSEKSKEVVRKYLSELDRLRTLPLDLVTEDYKFHVAGWEPIVGKDKIAGFTAAFFQSIPDLMHPLDEMIAEGDRVAFRYHYEGTHTKAVMGEKPTGNRINYTGMGFMRVRDGKVCEFIVSPDRITFMKQLGILSQEY
jgi:predicted ester cyclase